MLNENVPEPGRLAFYAVKKEELIGNQPHSEVIKEVQKQLPNGQWRVILESGTVVDIEYQDWWKTFLIVAIVPS